MEGGCCCILVSCVRGYICEFLCREGVQDASLEAVAATGDAAEESGGLKGDG